MQTPTLPADLTDRYLQHLGVPAPGSPTLTALFALHRAHVTRVPFENLEIQLGGPTTIDPQESAERIVRGRGGYCFHLNGAFAALLETLGYEVERHTGGIQRTAEQPAGASGDHLTLTVRCEGEVWLVDVGLGQGLYEPVPLREGTYQQGLFTLSLAPSAAEPDGWRLTPDPQYGYVGMDFLPKPAAIADFTERHDWLSTSPESPFTPFPCAFRQDATGIDVLRGCVLVRVDADGRHVRELASATEWFDTLRDTYGLDLPAVGAAAREAYWERISAAHQAWKAMMARKA
ncbi:arylamine N-acetyltransferase family protein [Kitasatospora sp. McL0602]|uniref:arylamine N-acetyltransferase family protein n=1 Tax=Kitasatospora sp. McL0602 TaxID=3439530 RepID=UPI003F8915BC